jgi:glycine cleavage system regulatory protein
LIINAVGSDRLGIVSDMTQFVTDVGGNVGESQAAKLGSHFSLMMLVTVPEAKVWELTSRLSSMPDMNASVYHATEETKPNPKVGCKKERDSCIILCVVDIHESLTNSFLCCCCCLVIGTAG